MTEMSMGMIEDNDVRDALGVGDLLRRPVRVHDREEPVVATRPDVASDDLTRAGYGIVAHYGAVADVRDNTFAQSRGAAAFADGRLAGG